MKEGQQFEVLKWAVVIVILFVVYRVLKGVGLIQSAQEQKQEQQREQAVTATIWNPNLHTNYVSVGEKKPVYLLRKAERDELARKLWNAKGIFNDDEEAIYAVFRSLRYQTQVASIVLSFKELFNQDLVTWLKSVLSDDEFTTVLNIISAKTYGYVK